MEYGGRRRNLARPERLELPTPRFVVWCSIQLSYGRSMPGAAPATGGGPYTKAGSAGKHGADAKKTC